MVHLITLPVSEVHRIDSELSITQRLTKSFPSGLAYENIKSTQKGLKSKRPSPQLALVLEQHPSGTTAKIDHQDWSIRLAWMGVVLRSNTVGSVDKSITIDPLRKCTPHVPFNGKDGLLSQLPQLHRSTFESAVNSGEVSYCDNETWEALSRTIREKHPSLVPLLDWLTAQANASKLRGDSAEERSWQEQQDAARTVLRLADFPLSAFAAWQRPSSPHAPYLAGLIPEPVEHSMIDHDARVSVQGAGFFDQWSRHDELRCDIHTIHDATGRRLEVANVNATPVESRLGTDLIYYHEPTHSFVLVQYKRLSSSKDYIVVDQRLLGQLDRLTRVAHLSRKPARPHDWRLGHDPCFLKLAYWPEDRAAYQELTPGMYLPLSYVRLLLADECTRGRGDSRLLGYDNIERYLVSTQFIQLVRHGLAGTVGTTVRELCELGKSRAHEGYAVMLAAERSFESERERQTRSNRRGHSKLARSKLPPEPTLFN